MSMFFNKLLFNKAFTTDKANSKHCTLQESNVRWKSRTSVTKFVLAYFTLDLSSIYEHPADGMSKASFCQNNGWYKAVRQCLHVDEAATLDFGDR